MDWLRNFPFMFFFSRCITHYPYMPPSVKVKLVTHLSCVFKIGFMLGSGYKTPTEAPEEAEEGCRFGTGNLGTGTIGAASAPEPGGLIYLSGTGTYVPNNLQPAPNWHRGPDVPVKRSITVFPLFSVCRLVMLT